MPNGIGAVASCHESQGFMAKPCTPHLIPQAEQFFEIETANVGGRGDLPSRSLGGPRGIFSHVREWPPFPCSAKGAAFSRRPF